MIRTTRCFAGAAALAMCAALVATSSIAQAASINYGNFGPVPPGVSFLQVTESSGTDTVPLYGPPTPFATGLDFDPSGFVSQAVNGSADITDGQLNYTIMGPSINTVSLFEAGDYSLAGIGTVATQVNAGAIIRATVTQINGLPVAPINLAPANASVGFNLLANPGVVQPWSLGSVLNIAGQLGPNQHATKVDISINNQLLAISQPGTVAFIAKKEFILSTNTVPEPMTAGLAGLALCGLGLIARKRS